MEKSGRLLIIGGTGFIGKNLVIHAVQADYKVSVLSLNKPAKNQSIKDVSYIQADITDVIALKNKLSDIIFDYVVNLSGYIDHSNFLEGGKQVLDMHFLGVQNIFQCLDWKQLKRFVQIGSSDEYGNLPAPQHESLRESPISSYSLGKVASTQLLQMLHRTQDLPVVILRLFLVYGVGQDDKRFLPQVIQGCLSNNPFPVSAGKQLRDFCYIDDISQGILLSLTNDKVNGEIINLASGIPITIKEVVESVKSAVGQGKPEFGKVPYRKGENMSLYADTSKASDLLDWMPKMILDEGIKRTVDHYIKNN